MQSEEGEKVDLYEPRKWFACWYDSILTPCSSATNRLITAKDHASVQINVGHVDANGFYTGQFSAFALCGFIRSKGDADDGLNRVLTEKGFLKHVY
jgi:small subunit ribosomal protein S21e